MYIACMMKRYMLYPGLGVLLLALSCSDDSTRHNTSLPAGARLSLGGKLYRSGPELDPKTCEATGACDCCMGHMYFMNDSEFVAAEYCLHDNFYYRGTYRVHGSRVLLQSSGPALSGETQFDSLTADFGSSTLYTLQGMEPSEQEWSLSSCGEKNVFLTGSDEMPYASEDPGELDDFTRLLTGDSVLLKLKAPGR